MLTKLVEMMEGLAQAETKLALKLHPEVVDLSALTDRTHVIIISRWRTQRGRQRSAGAGGSAPRASRCSPRSTSASPRGATRSSRAGPTAGSATG